MYRGDILWKLKFRSAFKNKPVDMKRQIEITTNMAMQFMKKLKIYVIHILYDKPNNTATLVIPEEFANKICIEYSEDNIVREIKINKEQ